VSPVLVRIGPVPISAFGVFLLLAFWVGIAIARRRAPAAGVDSTTMLDLSLYMIIAGILGARLAYVLVHLEAFTGDPLAVLTIWRDAGLAFYGALGGGVLVAWLFTRGRPVSLGRLLDATAPGLALGYAVAMVGALLHGLFRGRPTGVPWAVQIGLETVHPVPVYLLLAAVGIYMVLRTQHDPPPGVPFLTFVFLLATSRFLAEFFVDSPLVLGPLTLAQAASAVVAPGGLVLLLVAARRGAARPAEGAEAGEPTPSAVPPPGPPPVP